MSANIRFVVDSDSEFVEVKAALVRLEQAINAQGATHTMAFEDIKADLVAIKGSVANTDADVTALNAKIDALNANVDDLKAQIAVGMTPEQVAEVQALADQIKVQAKALADRTADAPEPVSPSPAPVEPPPV